MLITGFHCRTLHRIKSIHIEYFHCRLGYGSGISGFESQEPTKKRDNGVHIYNLYVHKVRRESDRGEFQKLTCQLAWAVQQ